MKKLLLLLFLFCSALAVQAQKVYFIYLQSENGSPFFVKMGEKVQSSTGAGYIILSNLIDSTYTFSIGFPGKTSETKFFVALNKEDKGYLLKTLDGGLSLFDLQALTITKSIAATKEPTPVDQTIMASADPFTRMLAQASDDPSLYMLSGPSQPMQKEQAVIAKEEVKPEIRKDTQIAVVAPATNTALAVVAITKEEMPKANDTITPVIIKPVEQPIAAPPVVETVKELVVEKAEPAIEEAYQRSVVTRRSESSTTEGFGLVFLDNEAGTTDTIRLLIPNPKVMGKIADTPKLTKEQLDSLPAVDIAAALEGKVNDSANNSAASAPVEETPNPSIGKTTCEATANDKDFMKLRKNMASAEDEPEMLSIARKDFSKKCFTTEQVRNLGTLFLTSIGKYSFFEAAYTHVSDAEQFAQLESELKDDTYSKRFKALLVK